MSVHTSEAHDAAVRYMEKTQPLHALLCQVLTQVAGCTLMTLMGGRSTRLVELPLQLAHAAVSRTREDLRDLRVPAEARNHFYHLRTAADAIEAAFNLLDACRESAADDLRQRLSRLLRIATEHLRAASKLVPGHPMVDLSQACCAARARAGIHQH